MSHKYTIINPADLFQPDTKIRVRKDKNRPKKERNNSFPIRATISVLSLIVKSKNSETSEKRRLETWKYTLKTPIKRHSRRRDKNTPKLLISFK